MYWAYWPTTIWLHLPNFKPLIHRDEERMFMYRIDYSHLMVFCIVFVWPGGRHSPVRIIAQVQWFIYQNWLEPSSGIYHWYKHNHLLWLHVNIRLWHKEITSIFWVKPTLRNELFMAEYLAFIFVYPWRQWPDGLSCDVAFFEKLCDNWLKIIWHLSFQHWNFSAISWSVGELTKRDGDIYWVFAVDLLPLKSQNWNMTT